MTGVGDSTAASISAEPSMPRAVPSSVTVVRSLGTSLPQTAPGARSRSDQKPGRGAPVRPPA